MPGAVKMHFLARCAVWTRSLSYPVKRKLCHRWQHTKCTNSHQKIHGLIENNLIKYQPEVKNALSAGKPIVALESTIITHGMPYPHNLRTAQEVESIVSENGVTPATIALMNGKINIGLTQNELEHLAKCTDAIKTSRRDIAWVLSQGLTGGTTVSATMLAAHLAGIPVFVTGGIGGVHIGGETSMDISADLTELGRTPITVVSAGIKSILDIPRTLEYLETQGVTVVSFGASSEFPAFFTPNSGQHAQIHVTSAREAAELIDCNLSLSLGSGILIGVPIPASAAADGQVIEDAIQVALKEARNEGISGKDVTPFVLERVNRITKGKSLKANIALVKNNADVGSKIAKELACIRNRKNNKKGYQEHETIVCETTDAERRPVVIGGSNVDLVSSVKNSEIMYGDKMNNGSIHISVGGVGRNVADCLSQLGASPLFVSTVGSDHQGRLLLDLSSHMDTSGIAITSDYSTATYVCVLDRHGQLVVGLGDMDITTQVTAEYVSKFENQLRTAPLVCIDGNIPRETIEYVCKLCSQHNVPVWYEPTSVIKSTEPFQTECWKMLSYVSPNYEELCAIVSYLDKKWNGVHPGQTTLDKKLSHCIELSRLLLQHMYCVVVTLGEDGVLVCRNALTHELFVCSSSSSSKKTTTDISAVHYPAHTVERAASVSGAGDCFAGGMIAGIIHGLHPDTCVLTGLAAAKCSIQSYLSVPRTISSVQKAELSKAAFGRTVLVTPE